MNEAAPLPEAAVVAEKLTKRYGSLTAVEDLSFSVAPGEIVGFLGETLGAIVFKSRQTFMLGVKPQPAVQEFALLDGFHNGWICADEVHGRCSKTNFAEKFLPAFSGLRLKFSMKE